MTNRHSEPISDPGGIRPVAARWIITADLILDSAAHFGGRQGDAADMVLLRDPHEGGPLLPGTSLAGALRSHLGDILGGYRSSEDQRVTLLFGGARGDDIGAQSPLVVFDAIGILPEGCAVEIRDGVQIHSAHGTAEDKKKFDLEVLPEGTRFPVRFELVVPRPDVETDLVNLLLVSLSGIDAGEVSLGARRSRGFGALRAENWRAVRHPLDSDDGWIGWLTSDAETPIPGEIPGAEAPTNACRRAWPALSVVDHDDRRRRLVVDAQLSLKGGLLVRSMPPGADEPDTVHLQSAGRSVLPGTSMVGILRARAMRVADVVRAEAGDATQWVERLFGPRMEGETASNSPVLQASRLRVSESVVKDGARLRPSRIRIDRFTQGVVPGALFDEEPEYGGSIRMRFELRDPKPGEAGLLFLLFKDLLGGDIPVGGSSAVGRGFLGGVAEAHMEDGAKIRLESNGKSQDPSAVIERSIDEFWEAPTLGGSS